MGQIGTAFRAFFVTLFNAERARQIQAVLDGQVLPKITLDEKMQQPTTIAALGVDPPHKRSEAVTLLAALQRESRLVDLIQESLDNYTDEQIGAAARNVLRDAGSVVDRFFRLQPVLAQEEQSAVEVAAGYDPARFKLT